MKNIILIIMLLIFSVTFTMGEEGGGVTGADFLIAPTSIRTDAMGNVADGMYPDLSSIPYNPAILALFDDFSLQASMTPYPNSVSDITIQGAIPLGPGVLGINSQLLNIGEFTSYNSSGIAIGTVNIMDTAISAGYGYSFTDWLSAGAMLKGIYRGLGEYWAMSAAMDLGVHALFETPHIGQRPKAESIEQVKFRYDKTIEHLEKELASRLEEAAKVVVKAEKEFTSAKDKLKSMNNKRVEEVPLSDEAAAAKAKEKSDTLEAEIAAQDEIVAELEAALSSAQKELSQEKLNQADWMDEQKTAAEQTYRDEIAYLVNIEEERKKIYSVIDDPSKGLTNEVIDNSINSLLERLESFRLEQREALTVSSREYVNRRESEIKRAEAGILAYEVKISDEIGDTKKKLDDQIAELNVKIESLEELEAKAKEEAKTAGESGDADAKAAAQARVSDLATEVKIVSRELDVPEKALAELQKDTWIKRLTDRISDKNSDIAEFKTEIEEKDKQLQQQLTNLDEDIAAEIEALNILSKELKKDLKRSELQRDLDTLDASTEKSIAKAGKDFSTNVLDNYTRLITAMYELEERIFQSRIDAEKENAAMKIYDLNKDNKSKMINLEDDFVFAQRFLKQKIKALEKTAEDTVPPELETTHTELDKLEENYIQTSAELKVSFKENKEEIGKIEESNISSIRKERERVRLIYLQTDKPYKNTSFIITFRNFGLPVKFESDSYPMPMSIYAALGYSFINLEKHRATVSAMSEYSFFEPISFGVGCEYSYADIVFVRAGYIFGRPGQSITAGFGLKLDAGLSQYKIDYAFKPVTGYGYIHSFGITAQF